MQGCRIGHKAAVRRLLIGLGAVTLAVPAVFGVSAPSPANAATTITVTTTADELTNNGNCSLREAIQAANRDVRVDACPAGSGADTITVPAGTYALTLGGRLDDAGLTGDLDISGNLTINGAGASRTVLVGQSAPVPDRVLDIIGPMSVV